MALINATLIAMFFLISRRDGVSFALFVEQPQYVVG
jgi:hypothetical protein